MVLKRRCLVAFWEGLNLYVYVYTSIYYFVVLFLSDLKGA